VTPVQLGPGRLKNIKGVAIGKSLSHQGHDSRGTVGGPIDVNLHKGKKIQSKRKGSWTVPIVTEPEDKIYRISFFKRRRLGENTSAQFGYKYWMVSREEGTFTAWASMRDLKYKHHFSCLMSVSSGSGNTSFCIRMLQEFDTQITEREFGGCIVWCYGEKTAVMTRQQLPSDIIYI